LADLGAQVDVFFLLADLRAEVDALRYSKLAQSGIAPRTLRTQSSQGDQVESWKKIIMCFLKESMAYRDCSSSIYSLFLSNPIYP